MFNVNCVWVFLNTTTYTNAIKVQSLVPDIRASISHFKVIKISGLPWPQGPVVQVTANSLAVVHPMCV